MRAFLLILACLAATAGVRAADIAAADQAALDALLDRAVADTHIPGVVALVVDGSGVLYEGSAGLMHTGAGTPMRTDAIFRLASMGKAITSTAVMMLVEEGRIGLDDPVSNYLPALTSPRVFTGFEPDTGAYESRPANGPVTIRQLLTHTSGLGYTFTSERLNTLIGADFNRSVTDFPLLFEPGTNWHYGQSTRVLGEVIEAVSGQGLDAFFQDRLLGPLGMDDTGYDVPAAKNARVVTVHQFDGTAMVETPNPAGVISAPPVGDGGLSGTASDYGRFIRLFLNGGKTAEGRALITPATVAMMSSNQTAPVTVRLMRSTNPALSRDFPLGAGIDSYSLGFQRTEQARAGTRPVGSLSWAGIYNTEFWIDPVNGIGAVLLMQYLPFYDPAAITVLQDFEQQVYKAIAADRPGRE